MRRLIAALAAGLGDTGTDSPPADMPWHLRIETDRAKTDQTTLTR